MSMIGKVKILVVGDVEGRFQLFCTKVTALNQKNGPFEMVFCVGNFFGDNNSQWTDLERCALQIPIPTYILGSTYPEHARYFNNKNGQDLVPNLTYLGRRGIFTFSSGLKVAYLSGRESAEPELNSQISFNMKDVEEILTLAGGNSCTGLDILLTCQWPQGVEKEDNQTVLVLFINKINDYFESADSSKNGSALIAQLAVALKPRYHFAGLSDVFYERTPYRNHQILAESTTHVTRFIALATIANTNKQRFVYALNIMPMSKISFQELRKQPDSCTQCPYQRKAILNKKDKVQDIIANQYFYDMISEPHQSNKRKGNFQDHTGKKPQQQAEAETGTCWFCLSSPEAEKHLVVSVGLHTYVALAKGGLTPDHVLILPIFHLRSYPELEEDAATELEKYKKALMKLFADQDKSTVFFERNFKSKHMQLQVVPIPRTHPDKVKQLFLHRAEESQLKLTEIPSRSDLGQIIKPGQTFFYVELDDGQKMFYKIDQKGFPLQFGRDVLASKQLLNMPDRVDWRQCQASVEEQTQMANQFKAAFKAYDFNFQ